MAKLSDQKSKRVLIVGQMASYAGAGPLANAFEDFGDSEALLVAGRPDKLNFHGLYKAHVLRKMGFLARRKLRKVVEDTDLTLIAGTPGLETWFCLMDGRKPNRSFDVDRLLLLAQRFTGSFPSHPVALLVTDSYLLMKPDELNAVMASFPQMHIFAMPDLIPFIRRDRILPFYPGTGSYQRSEDRPSRERPLIGHSPSREARFEQKGTKRILEVLARHGLDHDLISGLPYAEALARKSNLDIFIDQIASPTRFPKTNWSGGIGKSGLEAMALGCAVVTSGSLAETEPYMPLPPVLMTDEERFEQDLLRLVADPARIQHMGRAGREWYERYATTEAQARFVLKHTFPRVHGNEVHCG